MADLTYAQAMIQLFSSYIPTRVIYVAAKLGLADHIGDDGAVAQDLAAKLNVHPDALYRVMRVLAGLGVLRQDKDEHFFVTAFGDTLRQDSPQSVSDYAIYSHESTYERIGKIMDSVRTGEPVVDDYFAELRAKPEKQAIFLAGSEPQEKVPGTFSGSWLASLGSPLGAFAADWKKLSCELTNAKLFPALLGMPEVVLRLLSKPTFRRRAEGNGQTHRHLGTNPSSTIQNRR